MKAMRILFFITTILVLCISCATLDTAETKNDPAILDQSKNSPFTHGSVQLSIKKGITTQTEVLEKFGAPNIATIDSSGYEVWTYQKYATVAKGTDTRIYATVIIVGGTAGSSGFEQSSKTMTLILKFDERKKVIDFKSMTTNF
jgi:hypothetical protein